MIVFFVSPHVEDASGILAVFLSIWSDLPHESVVVSDVVEPP